MRRAIRSVLPTTMADTYTLNRRRQICRSAPDIRAPNARTERHRTVRPALGLTGPRVCELQLEGSDDSAL
jgi:hypothetical protein